ncbi:cupin domain-containing protein [Catellatospora sp. NPDC049111]|uniref:cupin domain-containing protein n=1 Tax=Catellatospora sp. NPDC049111 TaxID=3155271 RepID=UPI0033E4671E
MIRLVRLYTGPDGRSHVEESALHLGALGPDAATGWLPTIAARFRQSPPGSALTWHDAPRRQYVVTLTGTLEFTTRDGETFRLGPGDVLLAEDTTGGGHRWRLLDDQPWTRVYLQLPASDPAQV